MARDEAYSDDIDWLDVSSADAPGGGPPRRPLPRWLTLAATGAVVAVVVAVLNIERRDQSASSARPTPSASSSQAAPSTSAAATPPLPPVSVTELGHRLLNATGGWELVGRGPGALVRIQPATGRITRTAIPDLRSGGPVYLVAGPDRVIVRPLDYVPAYVVPDGQPARELSPLVNESGPVFPGPAPGQMWVRPADDHQPVMALATLDGARLAGFVPVPSGSSPLEAIADGGGYLLFPSIGGIYQARPGGLRRISTGLLLATGPSGWLVTECDAQYRCQTVLVNRANGRRQTVAARPVGRDARGVISPDGSRVAVLTARPQGTVEVAVLDVARGSWLRVANLAVNEAALDGALAFSPDSKWLFAVTAGGSVAVIDPRTSTADIMDLPLPPVTQLLVRPVVRGSAPGAPLTSSEVAAALTPTCCRPTPEE